MTTQECNLYDYRSTIQGFNNLRVRYQKWVPYSQRYLFNTIPDTNHNANPTNPNTRYRIVEPSDYWTLRLSIHYRLYTIILRTLWRLNVIFSTASKLCVTKTNASPFTVSPALLLVLQPMPGINEARSDPYWKTRYFFRRTNCVLNFIIVRYSLHKCSKTTLC